MVTKKCFFLQIYHIPWIYAPVRTVLAIWHQLTKSEVRELSEIVPIVTILTHPLSSFSAHYVWINVHISD